MSTNTTTITSVTYDEVKSLLKVDWQDSRDSLSYTVAVQYTLEEGQQHSFEQSIARNKYAVIDMTEIVPNWIELFSSVISIECSVDNGTPIVLERLQLQAATIITRFNGSNITVFWNKVFGSSIKYRITFTPKYDGLPFTTTTTKMPCVVPLSSFLWPSEIPTIVDITVTIVAIPTDDTVLPSFPATATGWVQKPLLFYLKTALMTGNGFRYETSDDGADFAEMAKLEIHHQLTPIPYSSTLNTIQATYITMTGQLHKGSVHGNLRGGERKAVIKCKNPVLIGRANILELHNSSAERALSLMVLSTQENGSSHFNTYGPFGQLNLPDSQLDLLTHAGNILSLSCTTSYITSYISTLGFHYSTPIVCTTRTPLLPPNFDGSDINSVRYFDDDIVRHRVDSIKRIDIQYNSRIVSIQVTYRLEDGTTLQAPKHSVENEQKEIDVQQALIKLEEGDRVSQVYSTVGNITNGYLVIETVDFDGIIHSHGPYGSRSSDSTWECVVRGNVLGMKGVEGRVLNLGFYYALECSRLYGGFDKGSAFDHRQALSWATDNRGNTATGVINSLTLYTYDGLLTGISTTYYEDYPGSISLPKVAGNTSNKKHVLKIDKWNEYIIGISGKYREQRVIELTIKVRRENNTQMFGPIGKGDPNLDVSFDIEGIVSGFFGRSDTSYLYALGVYYIPSTIMA